MEPQSHVGLPFQPDGPMLSPSSLTAQIVRLESLTYGPK